MISHATSSQRKIRAICLIFPVRMLHFRSNDDQSCTYRKPIYYTPYTPHALTNFISPSTHAILPLPSSTFFDCITILPHSKIHRTSRSYNSTPYAHSQVPSPSRDDTFSPPFQMPSAFHQRVGISNSFTATAPTAIQIPIAVSYQLQQKKVDIAQVRISSRYVVKQ